MHVLSRRPGLPHTHTHMQFVSCLTHAANTPHVSPSCLLLAWGTWHTGVAGTRYEPVMVESVGDGCGMQTCSRSLWTLSKNAVVLSVPSVYPTTSPVSTSSSTKQNFCPRRAWGGQQHRDKYTGQCKAAGRQPQRHVWCRTGDSSRYGCVNTLPVPIQWPVAYGRKMHSLMSCLEVEIGVKACSLSRSPPTKSVRIVFEQVGAIFPRISSLQAHFVQPL